MLHFNGDHNVTLKIPSYEDYEAIYADRFSEDTAYWADDGPQNVCKEDYCTGRLVAQNCGELLERIIVLDGKPIGTVSGRDFVDRTCQCTLGIVIANPSNWGHGYGFEAARLFLKILAAEGIGLVVLETYANNKRAQHCFHKLGFERQRVFFSAGAGRYVVQMVRRLPPLRPIGERITRDDPRWKPPRR